MNAPDGPPIIKAEFKANPIPRSCSVQIYEKMVRDKEEKRRESVRRNAEASYALAKMPPTMQKWADRKKQEPPKLKQEEYSFKPQLGPAFTAAMAKKK